LKKRFLPRTPTSKKLYPVGMKPTVVNFFPG